MRIDRRPSELTRPVQPERRASLLASHLRFALHAFIVLTLARVALLAIVGGRVQGLGDAAHILLGGARMDAVAICYALAPATLLTLAFGGRGRIGRVTSLALRGYFTAVLACIVLLEAATPSFIAEYDSRPNRLFVEYLGHPNEVGTMLWRGYRLEVFAVAAATALLTLGYWRAFRDVVRPTRGTSLLERVALLAIVGPTLFLGARSSLQHRPANPSSVAFSSDHLLNDLSLGSAYSVAYAVSQMKDEADAAAMYGDLDDDTAIVAEVRRGMVTVAADEFCSAEIPTLHRQTATQRRPRPLNLVIILEESLGAQYVEGLGGEPIAQFLDTLADEGWWFEQMYATGTRSVRGIEAVVSGFLPTPARSVVKLGLSQTGFFTIAELLQSHGYRTQFVYGGESHFDNMKRFFTGNGFTEIIDRDDFENPDFVGSWGVCDDDILQKAHETFVENGDDPFFSLVFTVSNHSPWEYPEGRITPLDENPATVRNAVRYADTALGTFFDKARGADYWDSTLFVVVADHDSRVHGASLVPIEHFHIPAVIVGPGVPRQRDRRIVSQIDLAPTLLSLMGLDTVHPMVGFDLTALPADHPGRAVLQYGTNQAYITPGIAVIHQPGQPATQYSWSAGSLVRETPDPVRVRQALAHALLPSLLYREQRYRLPPSSPTVTPGVAAAAGAGSLAPRSPRREPMRSRPVSPPSVPTVSPARPSRSSTGRSPTSQ